MLEMIMHYESENVKITDWHQVNTGALGTHYGLTAVECLTAVNADGEPIKHIVIQYDEPEMVRAAGRSPGYAYHMLRATQMERTDGTVLFESTDYAEAKRYYDVITPIDWGAVKEIFRDKALRNVAGEDIRATKIEFDMNAKTADANADNE